MVIANARLRLTEIAGRGATAMDEVLGRDGSVGPLGCGRANASARGVDILVESCRFAAEDVLDHKKIAFFKKSPRPNELSTFPKHLANIEENAYTYTTVPNVAPAMAPCCSSSPAPT